MRTIIIGAGVAGIAAATRLIRQGFKDVVILEAERRIGGRILTVPFGEGEVDLGAHWIHGAKGNSVYELAAPLGLVESSHDFDSTVFVCNDKTEVPKETGDALFLSALEAMDEAAATKTLSGNVYEYLKEKTKELAEELKLSPKVEEGFLQWWSIFESSIEGCDDLKDASTAGLSNYENCDGDRVACWTKGGYSNILDILLKGPDEPIELENYLELDHEVVEINWSDDQVQVRCSNGTIFKGDHVIVTVSLGVLKKIGGSLFHPKLPPSKLTSIEGLGIGTVDKVYLLFPQKWWPDECKGFNLLYTDPVDLAPKWASNVMGFYTEKNSPNILSMWLIGEAAIEMENCDEAFISAKAKEVLDLFLGHKYDIPEPLAIVRSSWGSNPHFLGSYSYRSMKSEATGASAEGLSEPLYHGTTPRVLFAGEATHGKFYSTAHGALSSGFREADRLISYRRNSASEVSVVVVGAGLAGLSAALTLTRSGLQHVTVVEAQSIPGGRVRTEWVSPSTFVELGAQWIHGVRNPIYQHAANQDLLSNARSMERQGPYCNERGEVIDQHQCQEVMVHIDKMLNDAIDIRTSKETVNLSFSQYLEGSFTTPMNSPKDCLLEWHKRFLVIDNSCRNLDDLSLRFWGQYEDCDTESVTGGHFNFSRGFSTLIDYLVSLLPQGTVILNSPVQKIEWKPTFSLPEKACTITCNGTIYKADHVIFTPSIAFLHKNPSIFQPQLPQTHLKAMEGIGFATIVKIFLVYREAWWSEDIQGIQVVWGRELPATLWRRGLTGFDILEEHPTVLLGWVGGENATDVESMDPRTLGKECTEILKQFYSDPNKVTEPEAVYRSQWGLNEYVLGAYSHINRIADIIDYNNPPQAVLSKPVLSKAKVMGKDVDHPTILLAGEAIHLKHYSTTHGAYESGEEQAKLILNLLDQFAH